MIQEHKIFKEIKSWSKYALETPNKNYNNLPSCPYAKSAWKNDKVGFALKTTESYDIVYTLINKFHDSKDLVIVVDLSYENNEIFHNNLTILNRLIHEDKFDQNDIWLMGFHPDDDVNELIDDGTFAEIVDEEYALIFVQRLTKLQESANKLMKLGYYDKYYNEYNVEEIYEQRQKYYNQLKRRLKWQ